MASRLLNTLNQTTNSKNSFGRSRMNQSVDLANLEKLKKPQGPFAFQREGKIRELASLTDLDNPILENEILSAINKANKKEQELYNNVSISR